MEWNKIYIIGLTFMVIINSWILYDNYSKNNNINTTHDLYICPDYSDTPITAKLYVKVVDLNDCYYPSQEEKIRYMESVGFTKQEIK